MAQNRSSAVMQQRHEPHDSLDFFPTPPWATRALCESLRNSGLPLSGQTCWEPCCGEGDMARPLGEYFADVHATDVHDYSATFPDQFGVMDFASNWMGDDTKEVDWVITNPPFRIAGDIITNALRAARHGVAMFVRTSFLEGQDRYATLFAPTRPAMIMQFCERVPLFKGRVIQSGAKYWDPSANDGGGAIKSATTATSYCWIIWRPDQRPNQTEFRWIAPCRAQMERPGDYPAQTFPETSNPMGL